MFGRSKISPEEAERIRELSRLDESFFSQVREQKDMYDAGVAELAGSYRQMQTDAAQVQENIKSAAQLAEENTKVEAALIFGLNECRQQLETAEENQEKTLADIESVAAAAAQLVDENKHFTSPSKYLNELPAGIREQNQSYIKSLAQMGDYGKQIVVLSLNAAIEAGRMGDSGRQFVAAAEEIRIYASYYDRAVDELRAKMEQSEARIGELEEQIKHLVKLLKGNNVGTAKLMRSLEELSAAAKERRTDPVSGELSALKGQVTILKNADEEIIKSEERNRMQLEDMVEEFTSQQEGMKELFDRMDALHRHVSERGEGQSR